MAQPTQITTLAAYEDCNAGLDISLAAEDASIIICVERAVNGRNEWLPLVDQHTYREWTGCFSLLS